MVSYRIDVAGHVDLSWAESFEANALVHMPQGSSRFIFEIADQSALLGVLMRLHGLGIQLVSLNRLAGEFNSPFSFTPSGEASSPAKKVNLKWR
jgi:hypothetical protein